MTTTALKTASVLAFERKLDPSDALFASGSWAQRDLANRTVDENRLRARRLRERVDSPKMGREDRSWQERHRGPSGPQANF